MGSRSGFDADLELDELQNVIDRGSGAITVAQRQSNAQFNLGIIGMLGGVSGGQALEQPTAEAFAVVPAAGQAMLNQTAAQQAFRNSTNGAITLAAGFWGFEGQYLISETGTTSHTVSILFGGTAVLGFINYLVYGISGTTMTPATGGLSGASIVATAVVSTPALAAAGSEQIAFYGTLQVTTAGTFIPQVAYSAAPGAAPTMLKGSYIFIQPLNSTLVGQWS